MLSLWNEPILGEVFDWPNSEAYVLKHNQHGGKLDPAGPVDSGNTPEPKYSLLSSERKLVIRVNATFFHLIFDTFAVVLSELKKKPDLVVILVLPSINKNLEIGHTGKVLEGFKDYLRDKLKVQVLEWLFDATDEAVLNNFYMVSEPMGTMQSAEDLIELFDVDSRCASVPQSKKVYLSRRKTVSNQGLPKELADNYDDVEIRKKYEYKINDRMIDENVLEDYLISLGFEVVCPEDFSSFFEQLEFFAGVRCVVSVTSAGLSNCLFMKQDTTVVELITPLVVPNSATTSTKSVHPHYQVLSVLKGLNYVGIPHDRIASNLVQKIEENSALKNLLLSV